jgi:rhodanese-related sulfurtransferase
MKKLYVLALALVFTARLSAYGISPSRAEQGGAANSPNSPFQLQSGPQPQPSNALMNPQAQPQINNAQTIQDNIKNYHPDDWAKSWNHVTVQQAEKMHTDPSILFADARSKAEYDQGHIPGAIPLPLGEFDIYFEKYKSKILKAKMIVTYCHGLGCKLSDKVAQKLYVDKKLHNVSGFFGGWPQWQQNNLPVEVGTEPGKKK